jgi:uncharacterized protein (TIGR02118 family)
VSAVHKLIRLRRRPAGVAPDAFHADWLAEARAMLDTVPGLVGYVQNHCLLGGYRAREPLFDGYAEEYYTSADARDASASLDSGDLVLAVEVTVIRDGPQPPEAIKSIELIRRRPDLSHADFGRYWREHHGPLACAIPFLRYEQNHLTNAAARDPAIAFHGAAVTWFGSTAEMRMVADSDAYRRTRADEANFLDGASPVLLTITHKLR